MSRGFTTSGRPIGDRLAPKIALLVRHVLREHVRESAGHRAKIGTQAALDFFKTLEHERNVHLADLLNLWTGHERTHPAAEKALAFIHHGRGELSELLATHAIGGAVGTTLASGLANILAPVNQAIMFDDPAQVLPPETMAVLAAAGIVTQGYAEHIGKMSGIPAEGTRWLIEQARQYPSMGLLLGLYHRQLLTSEQVGLALTRAGIPADWHAAIVAGGQELLAPADLALQVLKGIRSEEQAQPEAHAQGLSSERLRLLVEQTGEPIGLEQLQEAYRRRIIDEKRLEHGVRQSRVRNEWTDVILALRYAPASPADALKAVIQGHLSSDDGKRISAENGLDPKDWEWLRETEGEPPGPMQLITLLRRRKVSRGFVEQGIRESRIKNKYIPHLLDLERAIPSLFQINSMLKAGSITEVEGARLLHELGYETDVVKGLVHAAVHGAAAKDRALAKGEIEELYYDHAITREQALEHLKLLGLHGHNAELALSIVDLRRERTLRQAAMSPIRSEYIARRLDAEDAKRKLLAIGLPHQQVEFAVQLWAVDREAHTKLLSEAQIVKANKEELLSDDGAETRLMALGYHHDDARLLLNMEKGRKRPAP